MEGGGGGEKRKGREKRKDGERRRRKYKTRRVRTRDGLSGLLAAPRVTCGGKEDQDIGKEEEEDACAESQIAFLPSLSPSLALRGTGEKALIDYLLLTLCTSAG